MTTSDTTNGAPASPADKDLVLLQLERLFAHPAFKNSKRCPALLRYIVEHQLQGNTGNLKERRLGIEVFGRALDYDTYSDPVVRTTANEIRKRIAQYYCEVPREKEIRIELPLGSYSAEFRWPADVTNSGSNIPDLTDALTPDPEPKIRQIRAVPPLYFAICGSLVLALIGALAWRQPSVSGSSLDAFWQPVFASSGPVILCVGTWNVSTITSNDRQNRARYLAELDVGDLIPMTDAVAFARTTAYMGRVGHDYLVVSAKDATLTDLMRGPAVYVGAFDNPWTLRTTDSLRFHFVPGNGDVKGGIVDRKDPSQKFLTVAGEIPGAKQDYAIVARLVDAVTGQSSVVIAGVGAAGTTAASDFLTDSRSVDDLAKQVGRNALKKNLEALLSVQVVDQQPGAAHIEAIEVW